jgi:hypothetical protein
MGSTDSRDDPHNVEGVLRRAVPLVIPEAEGSKEKASLRSAALALIAVTGLVCVLFLRTQVQLVHALNRASQSKTHVTKSGVMNSLVKLVSIGNAFENLEHITIWDRGSSSGEGPINRIWAIGENGNPSRSHLEWGRFATTGHCRWPSISFHVSESAFAIEFQILLKKWLLRVNGTVRDIWGSAKRDVQGWRWAEILEVEIHRPVGDGVPSHSGRSKDYRLIAFADPRAIAPNQGFVRRICGAFRSVGSLLVGAVHQASEDRVDDQNAESKNLRPKFCFVAPVLLSLAGYLVAVWGWWWLRFRNPHGWRELWCGLALIGGYCVSVIGGLWLGWRIF